MTSPSSETGTHQSTDAICRKCDSPGARLVSSCLPYAPGRPGSASVSEPIAPGEKPIPKVVRCPAVTLYGMYTFQWKLGRCSCRGVDSGERHEKPQRPATLPNLSMWMNRPFALRLWITSPASVSSFPTPCVQRSTLSPALFRLSTCTYTPLSTLCASYPQVFESYPHRRPRKGRMVYVHFDGDPSLAGLGTTGG